MRCKQSLNVIFTYKKIIFQVINDVCSIFIKYLLEKNGIYAFSITAQNMGKLKTRLYVWAFKWQQELKKGHYIAGYFAS